MNKLTPNRNRRAGIVIAVLVVAVLSLPLSRKVTEMPAGQQQQRSSSPAIKNGDRFGTAISNYTATFVQSSKLYSGMWWQPIPAMLETNYSQCRDVRYLEDVSFRSFRNTDVRFTQDWLDLNVEHLSKYVKHFETWDREGEDEDERRNRRKVSQRVEEILRKYIEKSKYSRHHAYQSALELSSHTTPVVASTIAVLPLLVSSETAGYGYRLTVLECAATVASLWNVGIPRIVIVGMSENERRAFQRISRTLADHLAIRQIELVHIDIGEEIRAESISEKDAQNVPKWSLVNFQTAQRAVGQYLQIRRDNGGHNNITNMVESWLGQDPARWTHVYFSEPDQLLHMRPEAIASVSKHLTGRNLLCAHRLNLVPHMKQFGDVHRDINSTALRARLTDQVVPNVASFAAIHELDPAEGDACCHQGEFFPSNRADPTRVVAARRDRGCPGTWDYCGFAKRHSGLDGTWNTTLTSHELLLMYPLLALREGTGLPFVSSSQQACIPERGPGASCPKI